MSLNEITYDDKGDARSFHGPKAIDVYRLAALSVALNAYAQHKMTMNRMLTPTRMLALANQALDTKYRRGHYAAAALHLKEHVQRLKAEVETEMRDEKVALIEKMGLEVKQ